MAQDDRDTLPGYRAHLKEMIDVCFTRRDDPRKRFAARGVTRGIFEEQRLVHLFHLVYFDNRVTIDPSAEERLHCIARKIRGYETSKAYCNALATLLYARCTDESLKLFAEKLLIDQLPDALCDDGLLPLPEARLCEIFGGVDGHSFWEQQAPFRPVRLIRYDEVIYENDSCPLPFVEDPELIGSGSYAKVYNVKIEKGHLIMDEATGSAYNSKHYAQKQFFDYRADAKRSFESEGAILKKFIQATKHHENILVTKASLEWGGTYSLFFDLAKYNLWEYFHDDNVSITDEQKATIFGRTIGLAGALAFLHDELRIDDSLSEQLHCYHLDLKPQNILVFEREENHGRDGNDIWKISDFGISKIKHIKRRGSDEQLGPSVSFLDSIFRPQKHDKDPSSGVNNSRYGGTYAAPEARLETDKVTRKSDIWSLGCVFSLVLTFLDNHSLGIKEFEEARSKDRDSDRFFESTIPFVGKEAIDELHSSVPTWLDTLVDRAYKRSDIEGKIVQKASEYLKNSMLLADQEKRDSAKDVEEKLMRMQSLFEKPAETPSKLAEAPSAGPESPPKLPRVKPTLSRMWRFIKDETPSLKRKRSSERARETWPFQIDNTSKKCKLSQGGRYLTVESDEIISTMLVSDIQQRKSAKIHSTPKGRNWIDSSMGSEYLCAVPESRYFECYYSCLSNTTSSKEGFVRTKVETRIRNVTLSPNDEITAFILEEFRNGKRALRLALLHTHDILKSAMQNESNPPNSTAPSEELPWPSIIKDLGSSVISATAGIVDLKFSSDSNRLIAVTEPYKREPTQPLQYAIIIWDVANGRRISVLENKLKVCPSWYGQTRCSQEAWTPDDTISTIVPLDNHPSFAAVSSKGLEILKYSPPDSVTQSRPVDYEILDILADKEQQEIIMLSRSEKKHKIMVHTVPLRDVDGLDGADMENGIETALTSPTDSQTVCCWYKSSEEKRRSILIANIPAAGKEGQMSVVHLD